MILLIAFIGAITNRIRGGGLTNLLWSLKIAIGSKAVSFEKHEKFWKSFSKNLHDVIFASVFFWLLNQNFDWRGLICFVAVFSGMRLGRSKGWGAYVGGLLSGKVTGEKEIVIIDKLFLREINHPDLRNSLAIATRGLMWSTCIFLGHLLSGVSFNHFLLLIIPVGLLMPAPYLVSRDICKLLKGKIGAWGLAEIFWGFILWGFCAKIILMSL